MRSRPKREWKLGKRITVGLCLMVLGLLILGAGVLFFDMELGIPRLIWLGLLTGLILGGVVCMFMGAGGILYGFGFVVLLLMPYIADYLPEPFDRYYIVVYVLALIGFIAFHRKKDEKEAEELERELEEELEELQKELDEAGETYDEPMDFPLIIGLQNSTGRAYQVIRTTGELRFYRCGGELKGPDVDSIQNSRNSLRPLGDKDFAIPLDSIQRITCKELEGNIYGCSAKVKSTGKNITLVPFVLTEDQEFMDFWNGIMPGETSSKPKKDETGILPEPDLKRKGILKKVRAGMYIYLIATIVPWMFLNVPYVLFSVLNLLVMPVVLVLAALFPGEVTLSESRKNGEKRVAFYYPLLASVFAPVLRSTIDFNILDWMRVLVISAVLAVALFVIFMLCTKEWKVWKGVLGLVGLALVFYCPGAVMQVNWCFDFSEPTLEIAELTEKHISTGSKTPDSYMLNVQLPDGGELELQTDEIAYEILEVGDPVEVYTWKGLLGIPYAEAYETE